MSDEPGPVRYSEWLGAKAERQIRLQRIRTETLQNRLLQIVDWCTSSERNVTAGDAEDEAVATFAFHIRQIAEGYFEQWEDKP